MKFDDLLVTVGEFGPYQRRLFLLLCLPAVYNAVFNMSVFVFYFAVPKHRCAIPGLVNDTYIVQNDAHTTLINLTIPLDDARMYTECTLYADAERTNWSSSEYRNSTGQCHQWVYDKSVYESTVSQSLDFVCDRKSFSTHAKSLGMVGHLIAGIIGGPLSDMFGRRKVILAGMACSVLLSICFTWINSVYILFPVVLLQTTFLSFQYLTCFVYSMEIVGPSKRTLTGVGMNLFWSAGNMTLALAAFLLTDWRTRELTLAVPAVIFVYLYFLPESPRWLFRKGKTKEGVTVMMKVANKNKVNISSESFDEVEALDDSDKEEFWELLKSPILLKRVLIVCYIWFSIGMCFYGLSMNVTNLSGNVYHNFFLFVIVEACAYVICLFLITRIHRKRLLCGSMLLAGISCILTFIPFLVTHTPENWIVNILACLGNTCVSAGFAVVYVFTAELMPTTARNFGIGISSFSSRIGSIAAPYINDLTLHVTGRYSQILPMLIFGGVTVLAGVLTLLLPETHNKRLPETIQDAEKLGKKSYDEHMANKAQDELLMAGKSEGADEST